MQINNDDVTPTNQDSIWLGGYKQRYPVTWEQMLKKKVDKTFCCSKELIDHIHINSAQIYKGTPKASSDFFLFILFFLN